MSHRSNLPSLPSKYIQLNKVSGLPFSLIRSCHLGSRESSLPALSYQDPPGSVIDYSVEGLLCWLMRSRFVTPMTGIGS